MAKYFDIIFSKDGVDFYTQKQNKINKLIKSELKIFDVNNYLFVPMAWDFWDDETKMLIPNYIKRKRSISLKTHDEVINWHYFICSNKNGDIASIVKYPNSSSDEDRYNISMLCSMPELRLDFSEYN